MAIETIDDVIDELGEIIRWSEEHGSRLGYFPALYRMVTIRVKEGIANGEFEDGARMEKLDVVFAVRYIDAFRAWQQNQPCTTAWDIAFNAAAKWRYIVMQHLFVGMNAHINLDLAIAAAEVAPGDSIAALESDFKQITDLLNELTNCVKEDLSQVWPLLRVLDWFDGRLGDWLANKGMAIARDMAWDNAVRLAYIDASQLNGQIEELDREVAQMANVILSPSIWANTLIEFIRAGELKTVPQVIKILSDEPLGRSETRRSF